ncbi:MAG TPA: hypothetical protein VF789_23460 [Thermoanaerobaculia bacterium]
MKKQPKRLTLHRETLRHLEPSSLVGVAGKSALQTPDESEDSCSLCGPPTVYNCTSG